MLGWLDKWFGPLRPRLRYSDGLWHCAWPSFKWDIGYYEAAGWTKEGAYCNWRSINNLARYRKRAKGRDEAAPIP